MSADRCEPANPHASGWHWVQCTLGPRPDNYDPEVMWWSAECQGWRDEDGDGLMLPAASYRYLAPVATPAEIAALRLENKRLTLVVENKEACITAALDVGESLRAEVGRLREALAAEREACAKVVDDAASEVQDNIRENIAEVRHIQIGPADNRPLIKARDWLKHVAATIRARSA